MKIHIGPSWATLPCSRKCSKPCLVGILGVSPVHEPKLLKNAQNASYIDCDVRVLWQNTPKFKRLQNEQQQPSDT